MDQPVIKEYSNGDVTVLWEASKCIHSGICLRGLPEVFDLKSRPWINASGSSSEAIVTTVRECPSKALSIKGIRFKEPQTETAVTLITGGPLIIKGGATIEHRRKTEVVEGTVSFCRCNRSQNFPYCDGTHAKPKEK